LRGFWVKDIVSDFSYVVFKRLRTKDNGKLINYKEKAMKKAGGWNLLYTGEIFTIEENSFSGFHLNENNTKVPFKRRNLQTFLVIIHEYLFVEISGKED